jgi:hypothetical protein
MKTNILQVHSSSIRNLWDNLSPNIKDRWGEDFFNSEVKRISNHIFLQTAENPKKVIQVLQHAVMNTSPRIRYRPGWQSTLFFFPLSMAPTWLADWVMTKLFGPCALPAGVRKQLSEKTT